MTFRRAAERIIAVHSFPTISRAASSTSSGHPCSCTISGRSEAQAEKVLAAPNAFGLTARYAMKACPTAAVVARALTERGLHVDASSGYEADRAIAAGVLAERIQLTCAAAPGELSRRWSTPACSSTPARSRRSTRSVGLSRRVPVDPLESGLGVGPQQSHQRRRSVRELRHLARVPRRRVGIGAPPRAHDRGRPHAHRLRAPTRPCGNAWRCSRSSSVRACRRRYALEPRRRVQGRPRGRRGDHRPRRHRRADRGRVSAPSRRATAGSSASSSSPGRISWRTPARCWRSVIDVVDTGREGYRFVKTGHRHDGDPAPERLYGAQHPIEVVPVGRDEPGHAECLVVGHCCESGDALTPARAAIPRASSPRPPPRSADRRRARDRGRGSLLQRHVRGALQLVPGSGRGDGGA